MKDIIIWTILLTIATVIFVLLAYPFNGTHKITDYTCEQIKEALTNGDTLIRDDAWIIDYHYNEQKMLTNYIIRCTNTGEQKILIKNNLEEN